MPVGNMRGTGSLLPKGIYRLRGVEMAPGQTKTDKLKYATQSVVVEPEELAGEAFFKDFVIGNDEDPQAETTEPNGGTWAKTFGGKQYKDLLEATGIAEGEEAIDDEAICAKFAGVEFLASLIVQVQKDTNKDGSPNEFAGNEKNEARRFFKLGEREPEITDEQWLTGKATGRTTTKPTAITKPVAAAKPAAAPSPGNGAAKPTITAKATGAPASKGRCNLCFAGDEKNQIAAGTITELTRGPEFVKHVREVHPD